MPKNKMFHEETHKERKMKRTREGSSQTDEDVFEDDTHDCPKCKSTNAHLAEIDEKLERLLSEQVNLNPTRAEVNPSKRNESTQ